MAKKKTVVAAESATEMVQNEIVQQPEIKQEVVVTPIVEATVTTKKAPGRPVVPGSARQQREEAKAARLAAGEKIQRGRKPAEGSERQKRMAARAAKIAAGIELKPGRPKMEKKEEPVSTPTTA
jgi:hypothetical protein